MFFLFGVDPREKRLPFDQAVVCPCCGRFGRYALVMTYMCFSLFFIPMFRWNKRYLIRTSCCGSTAEISRELAEKLQNGGIRELRPEDLHFSGRSRGVRRCGNCGYETAEDFRFCPKCGRPL